MNVFYFCNGDDPECSGKNCHANGGHCHHTIDRQYAREMETPRLFEELEPGIFFEVDPDKLNET